MKKRKEKPVKNKTGKPKTKKEVPGRLTKKSEFEKDSAGEILNMVLDQTGLV